MFSILYLQIAIHMFLQDSFKCEAAWYLSIKWCPTRLEPATMYWKLCKWFYGKMNAFIKRNIWVGLKINLLGIISPLNDLSFLRLFVMIFVDCQENKGDCGVMECDSFTINFALISACVCDGGYDENMTCSGIEFTYLIYFVFLLIFILQNKYNKLWITLDRW